jgi:rhodanese-related sulfurtransferase
MPVNGEFNISWGFLSTAFLMLSLIFVMRMLPRFMARVPFVGPAEVAEKMKANEDLLILDVRTPGEFASDHPRGAMNLPVGDLKARLAEIPEANLESLKATPVYVICASNSRAASAARVLKGKGFSSLAVIDGGVGKWKRQGCPMG